MKKILCIGTMIALLAALPTLTLGQNREQVEQLRVAELEAQLVQAQAAEAELVVVLQEAVEAVEAPAEPTANDGGDDQPAVITPTTPVEKVPEGTLRFHLMDGSVITGILATKTLPVKTEFGDLIVPITKIKNMSPGLDSHPKLDQRIQTLIQKLGDPAAEVRDQAQSELTGFGSELMPELQRFADDKDAERKARIAKIIEEIYEQDDSFEQDSGPTISLVRLDTIVTEQFTVAGRIQQDTFNIQSKFGKLVVKLEDIKSAEVLSTQMPEIRRAISVQGSDMAGRNYKNTGIKVNRGDRIVIRADGMVTMSPWGSNTRSTPEGMPNNGMYKNDIPMGALAGRIGDRGEEFKVGSNLNIVAKRSGTLYLGFAVTSNWQNYQFPGAYNAKIRVIPASGE